jgi:hypothetical protein
LSKYLYSLSMWLNDVGLYLYEQLKFARNNNYKIKVIKGYNFNRIYSVFRKLKIFY